MTPCGLVHKYQQPEKPAASTFNHVLHSVTHFLKQPLSEVRNKTDVTGLLLFCNATEHSGLTVGILYSILNLTSVQCFLLGNTMGIKMSPLFWDEMPRHRVNGVQHFGTTTATKHLAPFTQWHVPVEWRPQLYQCKSLKVHRCKQHHTCLKSCGFEIHRWDFGRPGVPKMEDMRLRGLWVP